MARVGPNQDINSPANLQALNSFARTASFLAQNKSELLQNQPLTGSLAIPISVALILENGNTQLVTDNLSPFWNQAVINTYIEQAERFRGYWNDLNIFANNVSIPITTTQFSFNISTPDCTESSSESRVSDPGGSSISGTQRGALKTCEFNMPFGISGIQDAGTEYTLLTEPIWTGNGPTNYNFNTYPQLLNEFFALGNQISLMSPSFGDSSLRTIFGNYFEATSYLEWDIPAPLRRSTISVNQVLNSTIGITIFNPTIQDIVLSVSVSLDVTPGSVGIPHNARKNIIVGPNSIFGNTRVSPFPSQEEVDALGGNLSHNIIVVIPARASESVFMTVLFEGSADSNWTTEEDRIPENTLNSFMSELDLTVTMQGISDDVSFMPVVSI